MNFKIILLCIVFSPISITKLSAQYDNVWAFGNYAGIDFNVSPPQAIKTNVKTKEGCASITDNNGKLLFYTDGTSVWNRNHNMMSDGADLPEVGKNITSSTAQGALIIPIPGNAQQYYVFSLGMWEDTFFFGRLYYSVIDMSLDNGLGGIVPNKKGIIMDSTLGEQMTAVSGNNCNIWLLVTPRANNTFKAYDIGLNGINPIPVVSPRIPGGGDNGGFIGTMDISPDRSKLAITQGNLVLYDFDPQSGVITNSLILVSSRKPSYYGVCFSPEGSKLYATTAGSSTTTQLNQFDLSINNKDSILSSLYLMKTVLGTGNIKRGPDHKVYCAMYEADVLGVVNYPELKGIACEFKEMGLPLLEGTKSILGLPNSTTIVTNRKFHSSLSDTLYCTDSLLLEAKNPSGINYVWEDGSSGTSRKISRTGVYWLSYKIKSPCMEDDYVDTFKIVFDNSRKDIITVTEHNGLCTQDSILLEANNGLGSNYTWNNNSTGMQRKVNETGLYWLTYKIDALCQDHVDSFKVTYPEKSYKISFTADTIVCADRPLQFNNTSDPPFKQFHWTFGDEDSTSLENPEHVYTQPGIYEVRLSGHINNRCADTAYSTITVDAPIKVQLQQDKDQICMGEEVSFQSKVSTSTLKNLQWNFGDEVLLSTLDQEVEHAYTRSGSMKIMFIAEFRACPTDSIKAIVQVLSLPEVDLGPDTTLCSNAPALLLKNHKSLKPGNYRYVWSTGEHTESITTKHPGVYSLTVSKDSLGCSATESITINKDCYINIPNAFTPNGDGFNDYFFPRQDLSRSPGAFSMQIFDRWGQMLFTTNKTDGRGWDGQWNGKPQPAGVYLYHITVEFKNRIPEVYQGNVTLMR